MNQFGTFDTREDRREILILFQRLGQNLPEPLARQKRADFLRSLIPESVAYFARRPMTVSPCGALEAYLLFVAITGVLGVPIAVAAKKLDEAVRRQ